jgi:hypothetical protein
VRATNHDLIVCLCGVCVCESFEREREREREREKNILYQLEKKTDVILCSHLYNESVRK